MVKIRSVLFVCTGNSCRSVMAEGLLKKHLKEEGKDHIEVMSAGVSAIDDAPPTNETVDAMRKAGVNIQGFKSRYLSEELIKKADLILVMSSHHMDAVIRKVPDAAGKVHLLKQYGVQDDSRPCEELDIPDPIGQTSEFYEKVLETIDEETKRIAAIL